MLLASCASASTPLSPDVLLGSAAWLGRRPDGVAIAFAVNSLPQEYNGFLNDAITALGRAVDTVRTWPASDLFPAEAAATPGA
jgi:hypothetical protein